MSPEARRRRLLERTTEDRRLLSRTADELGDDYEVVEPPTPRSPLLNAPTRNEDSASLLDEGARRRMNVRREMDDYGAETRRIEAMARDGPSLPPAPGSDTTHGNPDMRRELHLLDEARRRHLRRRVEREALFGPYSEDNTTIRSNGAEPDERRSIILPDPSSRTARMSRGESRGNRSWSSVSICCTV